MNNSIPREGKKLLFYIIHYILSLTSFISRIMGWLISILIKFPGYIRFVSSKILLCILVHLYSVTSWFIVSQHFHLYKHFHPFANRWEQRKAEIALPQSQFPIHSNSVVWRRDKLWSLYFCHSLLLSTITFSSLKAFHPIIKRTASNVCLYFHI